MVKLGGGGGERGRGNSGLRGKVTDLPQKVNFSQ